MAKKGVPLDGILLLNKPLAISANSALQRAKRLFNAQKAGHTGSLDPYASGMLPICFGEATKFSQYFLDADKAYAVTIRLGVTTATGDVEGEILAQKPVPDFNEDQIREILKTFIGEQHQTPSMFSAIKHEGKPLYHLARQGKVIERKVRIVQIYDIQYREMISNDNERNIITEKVIQNNNAISQKNIIDVLKASQNFNTIDISFDVRCSKGTYIRSLAEDIGAHIGCGAYVISLHRLNVAPFITEPMVTLETLETLAPEERLAHLMSLPQVLSHFFPLVSVATEAVSELRRGLEVGLPSQVGKSAEMVALLTETGDFLGIGERFTSGVIKPKRLIHQETSLVPAPVANI